VTSTHGPALDEIFPEPDLTVHFTPPVLPFATVAKILRVAPGIRLNPNGGCATVIPTLASGVPGVVGGVVGGSVGGVVGGVVGGSVGGVVGGAVPAVTFTVMLLQFTPFRLQETVPVPVTLRLVTRPPVAPELIVKIADPALDQVTALVQSVMLESEYLQEAVI
jgi:hypothetical protein